MASEKMYRCPDDRFCNDGTLTATMEQWRTWAADTVPDWNRNLAEGQEPTTVEDVLQSLIPSE